MTDNPTNNAAKAVKQGPKAPIPLDRFGLRVNSLKSKAAEMYASDDGATVKEIQAAIGSPQFRFLTDLVARGYVIKTERVKGVKGERGRTRYFLRDPE
jgi:hypothetical protein